MKIETVLATLDDGNLVGRIRGGDLTVWKSGPEGIADRLGWLALPDDMPRLVSGIEAFASEVREAGFRQVALLGMGGSTLGAEAIRRTLGVRERFPQSVLLDSTVPAAVLAAADAVEPGSTLFIVSSKSGTTLETRLFYDFFEGVVSRDSGNAAGRSFAAITDSGTPLEKLAREKGFRRVFTNPPDVVGRFSALSFFGLVPAALAGVDIAELLSRARDMRRACLSDGPVRENPGACLGATMAAMAVEGRDKLTLLTSPSMRSFGLWAEQLVAESTGKDGRGIIPIADEPVLSPEHYGDDRLFVYLRLDSDDNDALDGAARRFEEFGHHVIRLNMRDRYDLGAELFRWQFAVAVAGAALGMNPFDQPDVQRSKEETDALLREYVRRGRLPQMEPEGSLAGLLDKSEAGDYLSIMAFVQQTPDTDRMIAGLRRRVMEEHRIATTAAYGPRYLHSTGQLHKGGPNSGLFLQITSRTDNDVDIPGRPYTFGTVADAQAIGDLRSLKSLGRRSARVELGAAMSEA